MNNIEITGPVDTDKGPQIKQSIFDFSAIARQLRLKIDKFQFPKQVLDILNEQSIVSIDTKQQLNQLLELNENLRTLQQMYTEAWFGFQNGKWELARSTTNYTFEFTQSQISDLQDLPSLIEQFYQNRITLLNDNSEIQAMFWMPNIELISKLEVPLFTRLDMVVADGGKLQLVEIEPIYAGIGETLGTRDIYNDVNGIDDNFPWLLKSYMTALERLQWKNVLFCPNPKLSWYFTEVEYLFNSLSSQPNSLGSLNLSLNVTDLSFGNDGIYFEGEKLDVLMNYYIPKEQSDLSQLDEKIMSAFKKWDIKLFPEPSLELDSKLWLALAGDERYFNDQELYERFIPNTIIYNPDVPLEGDKMLKRISSNIEKDDFFDTSQWYDPDLIQWDSKPWIVQDKIPTWTDEVIVMDRRWQIKKEKMYARVEVYICFPDTWAELADVLVTMSKKQIVKWGRECVMVPATTKI